MNIDDINQLRKQTNERLKKHMLSSAQRQTVDCESQLEQIVETLESDAQSSKASVQETPNPTKTFETQNQDTSKYDVLVEALKDNLGNDINIEFSEKNGTSCLMVFDKDGLKLSRVRAHQRKNNKFDVALYRQDGTTLKMLFFNQQEELDSILKDSSSSTQ